MMNHTQMFSLAPRGPRTNYLPLLTVLLMAIGLVACTSDMKKLEEQVKAAKEAPADRVEDLPALKAYESFKYDVMNERSPFTPSASTKLGVANGARPSTSRPREFLEQFSLDTLTMVGTLDIDSHHYGLVLGKDGLVHRVQVGNHIGQADGRVASITHTKISIIELVPDGMGGYIERPASLTLRE